MAIICFVIHAQYSSVNSFIRKELVSYAKNDKGFYVESTDKMVDIVKGVVANYAYDKKAQNLYVLTENSNVVVTLTKDYAKIIKKNKDIPQLSGEELDNEIELRNNQLKDKFSALNREREQQIADSINKSRQDSIDKVNKHNALIAAQNKAREDYISSHKYELVPLGDNTLKCDICDEDIASKDVLLTYCIYNDSIYYATGKEGDLGVTHFGAHESKIPFSLKTNKDFLYHCEVFKDSLSKDSMNCRRLIRLLDYDGETEYWANLKKIAPFGYVDDWGWNNEYSMVTFNIKYTNTNSKTIKYLAVYFKITNDVGDIRKTGYFQGTGPLEEGETASWSWDSSPYFTSGDASSMDITKIVITYMNGTKQVVRGKYLCFN